MISLGIRYFLDTQNTHFSTILNLVRAFLILKSSLPSWERPGASAMEAPALFLSNSILFYPLMLYSVPLPDALHHIVYEALAFQSFRSDFLVCLQR